MLLFLLIMIKIILFSRSELCTCREDWQTGLLCKYSSNFMSCVTRKPVFWGFRPDPTETGLYCVEPQKMAGGLKFWI